MAYICSAKSKTHDKSEWRYTRVSDWKPQRKGQEKAQVTVFDLDNTLYLKTFWATFFYNLSHFFYKLSIRFEKFNKELFDSCKDRVIILTGRNDRLYMNDTFEQLKNIVKPKDIILCPNDYLVIEWKKEQIRYLKKMFDVKWYDDDNI